MVIIYYFIFKTLILRISGPHQKKYQFHVGQQSWLAAREICLAENSDLLTIADEEELVRRFNMISTN
jgi:hypothetical protein